MFEKLRNAFSSAAKSFGQKELKEKDINDMVLAGKNVLDIIQKNCYNGLTSRLKFNEWKRI